MTIEEMKQRKRELGLTNEKVAELSGVPLGTVQKIFAGATKAPRRSTIEALERTLRREPTDAAGFFSAPERYRSGDDVSAKNVLRETPFQYGTSPRERLHTLDDYYALPDEQRVELIDGVFYDMAAPSVVHQLILGHLFMLFSECAKKHDMPCEVLLSPFDVHLDRDNYTLVQPDILILCKSLDNLTSRRLEGAPDLAVEILSPSTRSKDMILKLYKYKNAGVREYWIVDPESMTVTVHLFEDEEHYDPKKYSFTDQVPVGISDGQCSIDLSRIREHLARYGV